MLERLVYRSRATHKLGSLHLFNLLIQCREKNRRLGITGHLLYTEEIFVQCIEGPCEGIEDLWQSLQRDERHHQIELLSPARRPVQVTRDLASFWARGYVEVKKELKGRYPRHYWPENPLEAEPMRGAKPRR